METSDVRRRVTATVDTARRLAAERRARREAASREWDDLLAHRAVPLLRQVAGALKTSGYSFSVATPSGSVRLASDANPNDFIELLLDSTGAEPLVLGRTSRTRGRHVVESEHQIGDAAIARITEEQILTFVTDGLQALVER